MGKRTAAAQKAYRDRLKRQALEVDLRFRSSVLSEIGRTFRVAEAAPLLAMAENLPVDQQAILLGGLLAKIAPKDFLADAGDTVLYVSAPHIWVKDGRLAAGVDLAAAPAGA